MEYDNMIFAANLRRQLARNGLKAVDLARIINVSKSTVSQWLKGAKFPRMDTVATMARVLDCGLSDLTEPHDDSLTPAQREMLDLVQTLTPEELSVLASTAKALKAARRDPGQK